MIAGLGEEMAVAGPGEATVPVVESGRGALDASRLGAGERAAPDRKAAWLVHAVRIPAASRRVSRGTRGPCTPTR